MFFNYIWRRNKTARATPRSDSFVQHIVIIDGTLSKLEDGRETHCGQIYKLLKDDNDRVTRVFYDPGVQGKGLFKWFDVITGRGTNESVMRAYLDLSENYRQGDQIYLFGYSRGAYAVRLLAGMIDEIGLLKRNYATPEFTAQAFDFFANKNVKSPKIDFKKRYCLQSTLVNFIGVFDTVKALGVPLPLLNRFSPLVVNFKDHLVPKCVKFACQALAYDEKRKAYRPELWTAKSSGTTMLQMLFPGTHGIIGGQIHDTPQAIQLSNYSMNWILKNAQSQNLKLPEDWQRLYPEAYSVFKEKHKFLDYFWHIQDRDFTPPEIFEIHPSITKNNNKS